MLDFGFSSIGAHSNREEDGVKLRYFLPISLVGLGVVFWFFTQNALRPADVFESIPSRMAPDATLQDAESYVNSTDAFRETLGAAEDVWWSELMADERLNSQGRELFRVLADRCTALGKLNNGPALSDELELLLDIAINCRRSPSRSADYTVGLGVVDVYVFTALSADVSLLTVAQITSLHDRLLAIANRTQEFEQFASEQEQATSDAAIVKLRLRFSETLYRLLAAKQRLLLEPALDLKSIAYRDPFSSSGASLQRMQNDQKGDAVYSVGPNSIDEGGRVSPLSIHSDGDMVVWIGVN